MTDTKPSETPLETTKVSTPRCAAVLMQKSWKKDMRELAEQLELELGIMAARLREAEERLGRMAILSQQHRKRAEAAEGKKHD